MQLIDRLFLWVRRSTFLYRLTLFTRILLVAGFVPTGMVKVLGQRFTIISPETPIGAFFEAMYQTGLYWQFIGLSQVIAALLLLFPRFAHLGAAIFLPIMINIFVITVSLDFTGTPVITGMMVLAASYLCFWDFDRFRPLLTRAPLLTEIPTQELDRWEFLGFTVFAMSLISFFSFTRGFFPSAATPFVVIAGVAAGLFTLCRYFWVRWKPS